MRLLPLLVQNPLIQPMVLPGILNGASPALQEGLGRIAREMNVTVQVNIADRNTNTVGKETAR